MEQSNEKLRTRYKSLTDEELVCLAQSELTEEALIIAKEELSKREITSDDFEKVKIEALDRKKAGYEELGTPEPPKIWVGFVLVFLLFVGEIIHFGVYESEKVKYSIYVTPFMVACLLYYIHMIRRIHNIMNRITVDKYPISTAKALGFHLIPLFNIYWLIKWPSELSKYIVSNSNITMIPGFVVGILLLLSIAVIKLVDGAIGYLFLFATMAYVTTRVKKIISRKEMQFEFTKEG